MNEQTSLPYPFFIRPLTEEEGGGFLIEFPDLPGCISDGETVDEAIQNGQDAMICWLNAAQESGREIPTPPSPDLQSGKWVQRVPRSIHCRLISRARLEGVSLNTLVIAMISEGLGKRDIYERPNASSNRSQKESLRKVRKAFASSKGMFQAKEKKPKKGNSN